MNELTAIVLVALVGVIGYFVCPLCMLKKLGYTVDAELIELPVQVKKEKGAHLPNKDLLSEVVQFTKGGSKLLRRRNNHS